MKISYLLLLLVTLSAQANKLNIPFNGKFIPSTIQYHGQIKSSSSRISQNHDIIVSYYKENSNDIIYKETLKNITITNGKFDIELGTGLSKKRLFSKKQNLKDIFMSHDKIEMSFTIDNKNYFPKVKLYPAGHSMQSSLAISGVSDNKLHSKGFKKVSVESAIQAVILSDNKSDATVSNSYSFKTHPLTMPMRGPFISQPASSIAKTKQQPFIEQEVNPPRHESLTDANGERYGTTTEQHHDSLANTSQSFGPGAVTPDTIVNFPGTGNLNGVLPPDIEGAVGVNYYVQQINLSTTIFNKDGTIAVAPFNTNQLWSGFGGSCESDNSGDAIALYDEQAQRWVLSQFAVTTATSVCFAVSTTSDPTGTYYLYELPAQRFPDYYKLGVWPAANNNAYFMATNSGSAGQYDVYAIDRESLINGTTPRVAQFFQGYYNLVLPADSDGNPPSDDTPGYLYTFRDGGESYFTDPTPDDSLDIFEYNVDWNTPANSTLTRVQVFTAANGLADFNWTICGFFVSDCLPQPGGVNLDSGSWWPLQRLQYRNFGDKETLVGTWVVNVDPQPAKRAAPRWFELNKTTGNWSIAQQGTYSPDAENRFLSSISMDGSGNIGMVYSKVSGSTFASAYYTSRGKNDAPGTMRDEKVLIAGAGNQTSTSNRWGDYASMDIDPTDNCTFWMTTEHIPTTGGAPWATQIGSFRLPECVSILTANNSKDVCTMDDATSFDLTLSEGFPGTTNLSITGCPTNASCDFSPNPVVNPIINTTLNITNLSASSNSINSMIVTGTDSVDITLTSNTNLNLNLFDAIPNPPMLTSPAMTSLVSTTPTLSWSNPNQSQLFRVEISDDPFFNNIISNTQISSTSYTSNPLPQGQCFYWRVSADNICGSGSPSASGEFYTNLLQDHPQMDSTDVPKTIIASGPNTVTSTLNVSGVGVIADVNINNFMGTHTWLADLTMTLTSPTGTVVTLMSGTCGNNDNWNINFDDEAASGNWPCPPTDGGTYQPAGSLSDFDGENADGIWTLTVADGFNGDGGSLDSWGLTFQSPIDPGAQVCNTDVVFFDGFEN